MTIVRKIALALAAGAMAAVPALAQDVPPTDDNAPVEAVAAEPPPAEPEFVAAETPAEVAPAPVEAPAQIETAVAEPIPAPAEPARAKASFTEKAAVAMGTLAAAFAAYQAFKDSKKKPAAPAQ